MIHYHGTPMGGSRQDAARFLIGRHALVPFFYPEDMAIVADVCQSFVLDNSAFTVWKQGRELDVPGYLKWVKQWCLHPGFDWALVPDSIEGGEAENDRMEAEWKTEGMASYGVPVWHLHESFERLERLCEEWPRVALGSSGDWPTPGAAKWWGRMEDVMRVCCDSGGRPKTKIHGLRMMNPEVFERLPLSSADSTNAAVNSGSLTRFGNYLPPTASQRAAVIAERIESRNSAPVWIGRPPEVNLFDL